MSNIFSLKTSNFGAWIGVFKPNLRNRKTCILSKLLHRFQPKTTKRPSWVVPTDALQIQDGGRPPSLKNRKIVISQSPFERFWRNLARGKTRFGFRLVNNVLRMIGPPPAKIVNCYGENQKLFCRYPHVIFQQGLSDLNDFDGSERHYWSSTTCCTKPTRLWPSCLPEGHIIKTWAWCIWHRISFQKTNLPGPSLHRFLFKNPRHPTQFATRTR